MTRYAKPFSILFLGVLCVAILSNCNKSSPFGAELLEDQAANIAFATLPISTTILEEDSVITSDPNSEARFFLCGKIDEPVFGESEAVLYSSVRLAQFGFAFDESATVKSVEMLLGLDGDGFYGDSLLNQTLEVYRTADTLNANQVYYSNQKLTEDVLLGSLSFIPEPNKGQPLIDTSITSIGRDSSFGAFIRIPLDNAFGQEILDMDSLRLTNDTAFFHQIRGLAIRSTTAGAMLGIDLNNSVFSSILITYMETEDDGSMVERVYKLRFSGTNKFVHFEHNRPSAITDNIGVEQTGNIYSQGLAGLRTQVQFDDITLDTLQGVIVNKAELVLTIDEANGVDQTRYEVPQQFILTRTQGDSVAVVTADVSYAQSTGGGTLTRFGGDPKVENGKTVYRLNLSEYFQRIIDGDRQNEIFVNMFPQAASPQRALFYGTGHPDYPMRLELKYTKIQ